MVTYSNLREWYTGKHKISHLELFIVGTLGRWAWMRAVWKGKGTETALFRLNINQKKSINWENWFVRCYKVSADNKTAVRRQFSEFWCSSELLKAKTRQNVCVCVEGKLWRCLVLSWKRWQYQRRTGTGWADGVYDRALSASGTPVRTLTIKERDTELKRANIRAWCVYVVHLFLGLVALHCAQKWNETCLTFGSAVCTWTSGLYGTVKSMCSCLLTS